MTSSPAYPVRGQCVEFGGGGGTSPFFAQDLEGKSTGQIHWINAHLPVLVVPDTCMSIRRRKTFDASRGIVRGTILFLAFRKRPPQRDLEMGDAVGPSEPPGSTHSLLKERFHTALFYAWLSGH